LRCGWYCLAWSSWRVVQLSSLQLMHVVWQVIRTKRCSSIPFSFKRVCARERSLGLVSNPSLWDKSEKDTRVRPCIRIRSNRKPSDVVASGGYSLGIAPRMIKVMDLTRIGFNRSQFDPGPRSGKLGVFSVSPKDCSPGCSHPLPWVMGQRSWESPDTSRW
jgi:hypothetical protein